MIFTLLNKLSILKRPSFIIKNILINNTKSKYDVYMVSWGLDNIRHIRKILLFRELLVSNKIIKIDMEDTKLNITS